MDDNSLNLTLQPFLYGSFLIVILTMQYHGLLLCIAFNPVQSILENLESLLFKPVIFWIHVKLKPAYTTIIQHFGIYKNLDKLR